MAKLESINIRPGVSVLSVLRHLNYRPWFAIAEFVDNSIQSYQAHRDALGGSGTVEPLKVTIEHDRAAATLVVRDTAAGIYEGEYARAFRPAAVPPDQSGLSEFGMGMKSAACWFSPRWRVETSAMGEPVRRTIRFDIDKIVNDDIEDLHVSESAADPNEHFTEIVLEDLYNPMHSSTVTKVKLHLSGIYREFFRQGVLSLSYNGEELTYRDPGILSAPPFKELDGQPVEWWKKIHFDFGGGLEVKGFAALRDPGSFRRSGFALFRRKRLIQGSGDEGYRPQLIFGNSNSYTYLRLFGELHLEGFEVSHTKDGFKWDENEISFLQLLKEHLDEEPLPLLRQAEGHRKRRKKGDFSSEAKKAVDSTARVMQEEVPTTLAGLDLTEAPDDEPLDDGPRTAFATQRQVEFKHGPDLWRVTVTLTEDPEQLDWLTVTSEVEAEQERGMTVKRLGISMALLHPFMNRFCGEQQDQIEPLLRVAAGLGIAEHLARQANIKGARHIRTVLNQLLREGLSLP